MKMNPQTINAEVLYNQRLLLFLEQEPQSNIYRQLLFTPLEHERVVTVLESIAVETKLINNFRYFKMRSSEELHALPDCQETIKEETKK